jgi:uncharacterized membrane protein YcaP (DUF421 family)
VVVIIADAVQNGMSGDYHSITEALVLAATIFGWATLIDWLDYSSRSCISSRRGRCSSSSTARSFTRT